MIASIMLYATAVGAIIAFGAAAAEHAVQGRVPARYIWSLALTAVCFALAVAFLRVPVAASYAAKQAQPSPRGTVRHSDVIATDSMMAIDNAIVARVGQNAGPTALTAADIPQVIRFEGNAAIDMALGGLWALASAVMAGWAFGTLWRWHRTVATLPRVRVHGIEVALSEAVGPAVVGVFHETILLPRWVVELSADEQYLIVSHEREHIAAHDSRRVFLALLAIMLMPWNIAAWWCFVRLQRSVELDCDSRVVSATRDLKSYGSLLLRVAALNIGDQSLAFQPAFLRISTSLERRIRALATHRHIRSRPLIRGLAAVLACGSATAFVPVPAFIVRPQITARALSDTPQPQSAVSLNSHTPVPGKPLEASMSEPPTPETSAPAVSVSEVERTMLRGHVEVRPSLSTSMRAVFDTLPGKVNVRSVASDTSDTSVDSPMLDTVEQRMRQMQSSLASSYASDSQVRDIDQRMQEMSKLMQLQARAQNARHQLDAEIHTAVQATYPNLTRSTTERTTVWFLADASGRVLQSIRDENGPPKTVSPDVVERKFGLVKPRVVSDVYYTRYSADGHSVPIIWSVVR